MSMKPAAAEHPFLICKRSEFAALRARASAEPWKSMKSDAIAQSNAGVTTTSGTTLQKYIGACILAYIVDEGNAATYKNRVRDAILNKLDNITFDPALNHAGTVPPMAAAFMCILGLDVVYDDLSSSEISSCESKIKSKIDLIAKTGSWQAARWGTHRTWEIYKGTRTTRDDEYLNHVTGQMTQDGVTTVAPNYAFARIAGSDDRLQKSAYMDILEYTGLDNRYYSNTKLKGFFRWLFGYSVTPARQYHMFGDVSPRWSESSGRTMCWRVGRFDYAASQYAAWLYKGYKPKGHLLSYVLMTSAMPTPKAPQSTLFMKGEAVFREVQDSPDALGCALYNITENDEWHTHEEVNAISASAYGTRVLVNAGWLGDITRPSYLNNTVAVNGARHSRKTGLGLEEGILGNGFDYACGRSGAALGNDNYNRSLIQVHGRDGANGYFLVADEVDADAGETAHAYLQTASESNPTEVTAKTEYRAVINHHEKVSGVNLTVYYATPPTVVNRSLQKSGDHDRDPDSGNHYRLESRYATDGSGDVNTLTILFPHNSSHAKASISRRSGTGFTGASIAQSGSVTDYVYVSGGSADCTDNGLTFRSRIAFIRKVGSKDSLWFARKGTKFRTGSIGFEASGPVSVQMDGKAGKITGTGADVTFYYTGITGVSLDGTPATIKAFGTGWCRVGVPAGSFDVTILDDGSSSPVDTIAPALHSVTAGSAGDAVTVVFDEAVDAASAGNKANYSIGGLTVQSAAAEADGKTVTLGVSAMNAGTVYTLSVSGINDNADPANTISGSVTMEFRYELCTTSPSVWQSNAIASQAGKFTVTWTAVPEALECNGLFTLSATPVSDYSDCAILVRFSRDGVIDARNGGDYAAANAVSYSMGTRYAFSMSVDVAAKTYSVSVTPEGGSETAIAVNYAFRTEQNSVSSLGFWSIQDDQGSFKVCDLVLSGGSSLLDQGFLHDGLLPETGDAFSLEGRLVSKRSAGNRPGIYLMRQGSSYRKVLVTD